MVMRVASGMARYGLPGLVLGIALCWGAGVAGSGGRGPDRSRGRHQPYNQARHARLKRPGLSARPSSVTGESNGTLAMITGGPAWPGQTQWLYLIDTKSRAFALYRIDPTNSKGIVKLEASRQYEWDLKLEHYNNQAPEPDAIKATVQTLSRSTQ